VTGAHLAANLDHPVGHVESALDWLLTHDEDEAIAAAAAADNALRLFGAVGTTANEVTDGRENIEQVTECAICFDEVENAAELFVACGHHFHDECWAVRRLLTSCGTQC
jgi:hypothetical protein